MKKGASLDEPLLLDACRAATWRLAKILERETSLELATSTLARLRSTN